MNERKETSLAGGLLTGQQIFFMNRNFGIPSLTGHVMQGSNVASREARACARKIDDKDKSPRRIEIQRGYGGF